MGNKAFAVKWATVLTLAGAMLMLVPGINALLLIVVMLPLWMVANLGVPGLGRELNGFFVPSAIGWCVIAIAIWSLCFLCLLGKRRRQARQANT